MTKAIFMAGFYSIRKDGVTLTKRMSAREAQGWRELVGKKPHGIDGLSFIKK